MNCTDCTNAGTVPAEKPETIMFPNTEPQGFAKAAQSGEQATNGRQEEKPQAQALERRLAESTRTIDRLTMELAKSRVREKRVFFWQCFDVALLIVVFYFLCEMERYGEQVTLSFFVGLFCCVRILIRAAQHYQISLKRGLIRFIRERREQSLAQEYENLKKRSAELCGYPENKSA